ncbi:MAG: VWA domain-containing protein [Gemmatimonadaceae bacterium]
MTAPDETNDSQTVRNDAAPGHDIVSAVVRFCRDLRQRGMRVTPAESVDAARTLGHVDLGDREEVRLSLRAVLVSRREDFDLFDEVFASAWRAHEPAGAPIDRGMRTTIRRPPAPLAGAAPPVSLQGWMKAGTSVDENDPLQLRRASDRESLGERDFSAYSASDAAEFRRLARQIARRLALRKSRRWRVTRRGERLDLRRTVQASRRTGGDIVQLVRASRTIRRTRLVALCDVSGSMELYSRFLLQFLHALQNTFARIETFAFATRLSRITSQLRGVEYRDALRGLGREVRDWSGGTRIGASLREFVETHGDLVDRRTIVLIMSDGWDVGEPEVLSAVMRELSRRAGRVIWLNPLMGAPDFSPDTRGMRAALPHVDLMAPGHSLEALRSLARHLAL